MSIFNTPKYDPQGSGSQVGATNLNKMAAGIDAATLRPGVGTMIQYTSGGMIISAKKQRKATPPPHPWKVTSNGGDTVTVGSGSVLSWKNENPATSNIPSWINLEEFLYFEGGDVEGITESGYIYAKCPHEATDNNTIFQSDHTDGLSLERVWPDSTGSVTIHAGAEMPTSGNDEIHLELAKITYDSGVVTVDRQILFHNPPMWLISIPAEI